MSGVLAKKFGRMYSRHSVVVSSVRYSVRSCLGVPPGEVGVALGVAALGQPLHHLRPGERLGEEDGLGVASLDLGDAPVPEPEGLGVRVVDPEDGDAVVGPEEEDVAELVPEPLPVGAVEVERVDVLVLLGRVLGVLDGAVGPVAEPLGVLLDLGVVRRALEGDVERDLDARGRGPRRRGGRSRRWCRARGGSSLWPPSAAPIAQGLPGSSGPAVRVLFGPFRKLRPIGWIGGRYRTSKPMPAM